MRLNTNKSRNLFRTLIKIPTQNANRDAQRNLKMQITMPNGIWKCKSKIGLKNLDLDFEIWHEKKVGKTGYFPWALRLNKRCEKRLSGPRR